MQRMDQIWNKPVIIPYFMNNKIRIIQICAGNCHSMALSHDNAVYSWGDNTEGQCGVNRLDATVHYPKLIDNIYWRYSWWI